MALLALLVAGCAQPRSPYTHPSGTPAALLRSNVIAGFTRFEPATVSIAPLIDRPKGLAPGLFTLKNGKSSPEGYVEVPANAPVILTFSQALSGQRFCVVSVAAQLREGHRYTLSGGTRFDPGFLASTGKCQLKVTDDATGAEIPLMRPPE